MIDMQHLRLWNEWRKHNINSKIHKILVLLKVRHSPTFEMFCTSKNISSMFKEGVENGKQS